MQGWADKKGENAYRRLKRAKMGTGMTTRVGQGSTVGLGLGGVNVAGADRQTFGSRARA